MIIVFKLKRVEESNHKGVCPCLTNCKDLRCNEGEADEWQISMVVGIVHDIFRADEGHIKNNADSPADPLKPD